MLLEQPLQDGTTFEPNLSEQHKKIAILFSR